MICPEPYQPWVKGKTQYNLKWINDLFLREEVKATIFFGFTP
jgi:hypothetical protein